MEKVITLDKLIIFPNTQFKQSPYKFIISARGFELLFKDNRTVPVVDFYVAGTDIKSVYDHFWNPALRNVDKVPAIAHMLYQLNQVYGYKFGYIQPNEKDPAAEGIENDPQQLINMGDTMMGVADEILGWRGTMMMDPSTKEEKFMIRWTHVNSPDGPKPVTVITDMWVPKSSVRKIHSMKGGGNVAG